MANDLEDRPASHDVIGCVIGEDAKTFLIGKTYKVDAGDEVRQLTLEKVVQGLGAGYPIIEAHFDDGTIQCFHGLKYIVLLKPKPSAEKPVPVEEVATEEAPVAEPQEA